MTKSDSTKRLIVCCDGTWQSLNNFDPTNVAKLAKAVKLKSEKDNVPQILYYHDGVGTQGLKDRLMGGAFGKGLDLVIANAYRFLCMNYSIGDEIYLFGFSRGAYTVRSLAGLIYNCGILKRENILQIPEAIKKYRSRDEKDHPTKGENAEQFRIDNALQPSDNQSPANVTLLGCWDTVGSLGIPDIAPSLKIDEIINGQYRFHDTTINPKIQNALHAVAIDERRKVFDVTPMEKNSNNSEQKLRQVWFPGDHGCVGGGKAHKDDESQKAEPNPFAQVTLKWMIDSIKDLKLGLEVNEKLIGNIPSYDKLPEKFPFENESKSFLSEIIEKSGMRERTIEKYFQEGQENNFFHKSVDFRCTQYPSYKILFKDEKLKNLEA